MRARARLVGSQLRSMKLNIKTCSICKRPLGLVPELADCGGDCLECMAEVGDPDAQAALGRIREDWRKTTHAAQPPESQNR